MLTPGGCEFNAFAEAGDYPDGGEVAYGAGEREGRSHQNGVLDFFDPCHITLQLVVGCFEATQQRFVLVQRAQECHVVAGDPQARLNNTLTGLRRKAPSKVQSDEVLVFGHTDRPFVGKAKNLANTGSWVSTPPISNTFVRLKGGKPRSFVFEGTEITQRADI
jgi:hypothetical protein